MKASVENWTVVMPGAWNPRVFTPEWIARHLLEGQLTIEVPLVQSSGQAIKFTTDDVIFVAGEDRLVFGCPQPDLATLIKAERFAHKLLELLPHTPVAAIGINLMFTEEHPGKDLRELFRTSDLTALGHFKCSIARTSIERSVEIDGTPLNFAVAQNETCGVDFRFNFHRQMGAQVPLETLPVPVAEHCFMLAANLMANVYKLSLEEADGQGPV